MDCHKATTTESLERQTKRNNVTGRPSGPMKVVNADIRKLNQQQAGRMESRNLSIQTMKKRYQLHNETMQQLQQFLTCKKKVSKFSDSTEMKQGANVFYCMLAVKSLFI